jgi:acetoacetate decarboxylase
MKASYFIPKEKLMNFMAGASMNSQEGIQLFGVTDPKVKKLVPPPLELQHPESPIFYVYIVNIREPTFAPWYMEGGIGLMARYGEKEGLYFFNLQLSGPGALMGAFSGRESSGLPKKLCEKIVVDRVDDYAHCFIERKGVRLIDVELTIGQYNAPTFSLPQDACIPGKEPITTDGGCLLHKYRMSEKGFTDIELLFYDSPTRYSTWEKASASVKLTSTIDDPWGEIPVVSVLGAGWMVSDNWVNSLTTLYRYPDDEVANAMQYLFSGRYDRCTLCKKHQRYE